MGSERLKDLFTETLEALALNGKRPSDVVRVGRGDGALSMRWEDFAVLAREIEYDAGHGADMIDDRLMVIGRGWWLERAEYDGSEWWSYRKMPVVQAPVRPFRLEKMADDQYTIVPAHRLP
jgi:hypothetical protein